MILTAAFATTLVLVSPTHAVHQGVMLTQPNFLQLALPMSLFQNDVSPRLPLPLEQVAQVRYDDLPRHLKKVYQRVYQLPVHSTVSVHASQQKPDKPRLWSRLSEKFKKTDPTAPHQASSALGVTLEDILTQHQPGSVHSSIPPEAE
jgi:hypothetical protein